MNSSDEDSDVEILKGIKKDAFCTNEVNSMQIGDANPKVEEKDEEIQVEEEKSTPSGAECLKRCKEFAAVTDTNTACAMFYLQDTDWDLEVYFCFVCFEA